MMSTEDRSAESISELLPLLESVFSAAARFGRLPEVEQEALLDLDDDVIAAKMVEIFSDKVAQGRLVGQVRADAPPQWHVTAAPAGFDGDWGAAATAEILAELMHLGVDGVLRKDELPEWARAFAGVVERLAGGETERKSGAVLSHVVPRSGPPVALDVAVAEAGAQATAPCVVAFACAVESPGHLLVLADGRTLPVYPMTEIDAARRDGLAVSGPEIEVSLAGIGARVCLLVIDRP